MHDKRAGISRARLNLAQGDVNHNERRNQMMSTEANTPDVEKLTVSLRQHTCVGREAEVAESIRQLPGILRVSDSTEDHALYIWFKRPTAGLLYRIATALESCGCEVAAGDMQCETSQP
jgi:hypothetical protein